jgi:hypothetical protein
MERRYSLSILVGCSNEGEKPVGPDAEAAIPPETKFLLYDDAESRLNVGSNKLFGAAEVVDGVFSSHKFSLDAGAAGGVVGSIMELMELTERLGRCDMVKVIVEQITNHP